MTHSTINDWQVYTGPFGVSCLRGLVTLCDADGRKLPTIATRMQLLWQSAGMFGVTTNGKSTTAKLHAGQPHADPYPSLKGTA